MLSLKTSSIVSHVPQSSTPHRCGYCGKTGSRHVAGIWGHRMRVIDYQILMDRGWRRCGKFLYKPDLQNSCCPLYTIRVNALETVISKTHRKVLRKMLNFLEGKVALEELKQKCKSLDNDQGNNSKVLNDEIKQQGRDKANNYKSKLNSKGSCQGPDPTKPKCRKAKDIRREKKLQKLSLKSDMSSEQAKNFVTESKERQEKENLQKRKQVLDDLINQILATSTFGHKLEVKLVLAELSDPTFSASYEKSHQLYQKYQIAIHKDKAEDCDISQFKRFLVDTALQYETSSDYPATGCGTFHQQYYLDGKLIAVGVLDILPESLSSVYFYYDPDFSCFSLGILSCLQELVFLRQIHSKTPSMQYYYMGLYNYDCKKLVYKGQYDQSYLLCPETYVWTPVPICIPKFKISKYCRLNDGDENNNPETDYNKVHIMYSNLMMTYPVYCSLRHVDVNEEIKNYATHIGLTLCRRMLLFQQ